MIKDLRKVCFVVMGFGKKTDYESGRTLDLDATYEAIIEPAVTSLNIRCIRSDEIMRAGIIDLEMYEMLLRADLVIADISTGNVNAVYELGVRHALRPNSTLIMKETDGKLYFDLDHISTFQYKHLGDDIGAREAQRARSALLALIPEVMSSQKPDSPVYTYLPKLQQPRLSEEEYAELLDETEAAQHHLASLLQAGEEALKLSNHVSAVKHFSDALHMKQADAHIIQRLALATYKSNHPSKLDALLKALELIQQLDPEHSNDPETLGIAGAIRKRLWLLSSDPVQLDRSIRHYARGFEIRRDYYNGENLASCYDIRAGLQTDESEALFDRMSAKKVRTAIIDSLTLLIEKPSFADRSDRRWVFATLANCSFAIGRSADGQKFETSFLAENPAEWESETYFACKPQNIPAIDEKIKGN
jgi:tetratricopeptide (TPR) repeat protein